MENSPAQNEKKRGRFKVALMVFTAAVLASVLTLWIAKVYLFPREFKPTRLNSSETKVLEDKIKALSAPQSSGRSKPQKRHDAPAAGEKPAGDLAPERYSETDANREISLTERELNGLLARNTDLARKMAIDLSEDMASAKLLIPLDPEFPIVGGKVLKITAGMELRYADRKPVVILKGVSVWGVPLPNAWLGGIKNLDLVSEFGIKQGFWKSFAAGVNDIRIKEGQLSIRLKP